MTLLLKLGSGITDSPPNVTPSFKFNMTVILNLRLRIYANLAALFSSSSRVEAATVVQPVEVPDEYCQ